MLPAVWREGLLPRSQHQWMWSRLCFRQEGRLQMQNYEMSMALLKDAAYYIDERAFEDFSKGCAPV